MGQIRKSSSYASCDYRHKFCKFKASLINKQVSLTESIRGFSTTHGYYILSEILAAGTLHSAVKLLSLHDE